MFTLYFLSLWNDVVARMCGFMSLAFTVVGVWSTWFSGTTGAEHSKTYFWIGAAVCFVVANYKIWANEHNKRVAEAPKFEMTIEHLNFEYQPDLDYTMLVAAIYLLNRGAPSVARGWHGAFLMNGAEERLPISHVDEWVITNDNEMVTVHGPDQIAAKTSERRLETGEAKFGRLFLSLSGDRRAQLLARNFVLRVGCFDFIGEKPVYGLFRPSSEIPKGVPKYPSEKGGVIPKQQ